MTCTKTIARSALFLHCRRRNLWINNTHLKNWTLLIMVFSCSFHLSFIHLLFMFHSLCSSLKIALRPWRAIVHIGVGRLVHSTCVQLNSYHEHLGFFFFLFTYALRLFHTICSTTVASSYDQREGMMFFFSVSVFNFQSKLFPTNDCEGELTASCIVPWPQKIVFRFWVPDSRHYCGKQNISWYLSLSPLSTYFLSIFFFLYSKCVT